MEANKTMKRKYDEGYITECYQDLNKLGTILNLEWVAKLECIVNVLDEYDKLNNK